VSITLRGNEIGWFVARVNPLEQEEWGRSKKQRTSGEAFEEDDFCSIVKQAGLNMKDLTISGGTVIEEYPQKSHYKAIVRLEGGGAIKCKGGLKVATTFHNPKKVTGTLKFEKKGKHGKKKFELNGFHCVKKGTGFRLRNSGEEPVEVHVTFSPI